MRNIIYVTQDNETFFLTEKIQIPVKANVYFSPGAATPDLDQLTDC
jgi:hypothetical protein